jgi:hypothetical protein
MCGGRPRRATHGRDAREIEQGRLRASPCGLGVGGRL